MATFKSVSHVRFAHLLAALLMVLVAIAISPVPAVAQGVDSDLSKQLSELQAKVTRLEAALNHQPKAAATTTLQPSAEGNQAPVQEQSTPGVPEGMRITAGYQNCLQCHQSRPAGSLPPSHLEALNVSGQGRTQAAVGQESSGAGMGQMAQGGQGMQGGGNKGMGMMGGGQGGKGMGGGMGMGMMGKGMGMMGGGMGGGQGMGMMGGGAGTGEMAQGGQGMQGMGGGQGGKGMGGGMGMGMGGGQESSGAGMGQMAQGGQGMQGMGGGSSMGGPAAKPMESQMQQMQQQIEQLQQQMQQMMQVQMQMQLMQMKMMQSN